MTAAIIFTAPVVKGAGRGRDMGSPTINLDPEAVPAELQEGIYACYITIGHDRYPAAMHFGPRPVFRAPVACEVHVIDVALQSSPPAATVEVIGRIRDIRNFGSVSMLEKQISEDIHAARGILKRR